MATKQIKKRLVLVNRDFQFRYIWMAIGLGVVTSVMSAFLILFPLFQFEILKIPRFLPLPILVMMVLAALINVVVIAVVGLYATHRIAGPMFAMVRAFRSVEAGHWCVKLRVRSGDDLLYVVRNFNEMTAGVTLLAEQDVQELNELANNCQDETLRERILALRSRIQRRVLQPQATIQRGDS